MCWCHKKTSKLLGLHEEAQSCSPLLTSGACHESSPSSLASRAHRKDYLDQAIQRSIQFYLMFKY